MLIANNDLDILTLVSNVPCLKKYFFGWNYRMACLWQEWYRYQKLTEDEIIQNVLKPEKLEANECDDDPLDSHAEGKSMFSKYINWSEMQPKYFYYVEFVILLQQKQIQKQTKMYTGLLWLKTTYLLHIYSIKP